MDIVLNIKLCTKGSCCPTFIADFDEDVVTVIDDDNHTFSMSCHEYEAEYRKTDFDHIHVVALGHSEPACISVDEYKMSWTEYWRAKSEYLAVPKL